MEEVGLLVIYAVSTLGILLLLFVLPSRKGSPTWQGRLPTNRALYGVATIALDILALAFGAAAKYGDPDDMQDMRISSAIFGTSSLAMSVLILSWGGGHQAVAAGFAFVVAGMLLLTAALALDAILRMHEINNCESTVCEKVFGGGDSDQLAAPPASAGQQSSHLSNLTTQISSFPVTPAVVRPY